MEKRNKLWRKRHQWRVYRKKLFLLSANNGMIMNRDGEMIQHPRWMDYATQSWCFKYKTMRTPCSCCMCRGESYNRQEYKKETLNLIIEEID